MEQYSVNFSILLTARSEADAAQAALRILKQVGHMSAANVVRVSTGNRSWVNLATNEAHPVGGK